MNTVRSAGSLSGGCAGYSLCRSLQRMQQHAVYTLVSVDYIKEFLSSYRGECEHCKVGRIFIMWLYGVLSMQKHADDAAACTLAPSFPLTI